MYESSAAISVLTLERYLAGEVRPEERRAIDAVRQADAGMAGRIAELEQSNAQIRRRYPADTFVPRIWERSGERVGILPFPPHRSGNRVVLGGIFGLAAAVLIAVVPLSRAALSVTNAGERVKGNPPAAPVPAELAVYLKTGEAGQEAVPLGDSARLQPGNTIQLAYTVGAERYGVIFSIDGRGTVTLHYPYQEEQSTRLVSGRRTFLEEAYTLDDAPEYEKFFFVIDDAPLDTETVLSNAEKLAWQSGQAEAENPEVFEGYEVKTVTILKE